jgi:hypothetical protein
LSTSTRRRRPEVYPESKEPSTPNLTVIYGPPLAGKTALAWELAGSMSGKTAVVSTDQLLGGAIAVPDANAAAELEMVHVQLRLLVANYLKNRYNVVVEGAFLYERGGEVHSYEADVDQLVALMRNLASRSLIIRLDAPEAVLARRAVETGREEELATALSLRAAFKARYGARLLSFDTGMTPLGAIVARAQEYFVAEDSPSRL